MFRLLAQRHNLRAHEIRELTPQAVRELYLTPVEADDGVVDLDQLPGWGK